MSAGDRGRVLTPRLICERLVPAHEAELASLLRDPRVARTLFADGRPPSDAEMALGMAIKVRHWETHGFGDWLLRDRQTGEMVGRGGLQRTRVEHEPEVEVGWAIVPGRWGQGLATELAQAAIATAFDDLGLVEIVAYSLPGNLASRRVMEKTGFVNERDIVHEDLPHVLYRRRK
jgi:[ribosomal protein S5]-alanine N-acetyltransferase